jgi:hypothetical protein
LEKAGLNIPVKLLGSRVGFSRTAVEIGPSNPDVAFTAGLPEFLTSTEEGLRRLYVALSSARFYRARCQATMQEIASQARAITNALEDIVFDPTHATDTTMPIGGVYRSLSDRQGTGLRNFLPERQETPMGTMWRYRYPGPGETCDFYAENGETAVRVAKFWYDFYVEDLVNLTRRAPNPGDICYCHGATCHYKAERGVCPLELEAKLVALDSVANVKERLSWEGGILDKCVEDVEMFIDMYIECRDSELARDGRPENRSPSWHQQRPFRK